MQGTCAVEVHAGQNGSLLRFTPDTASIVACALCLSAKKVQVGPPDTQWPCPVVHMQHDSGASQCLLRCQGGVGRGGTSDVLFFLQCPNVLTPPEPTFHVLVAAQGFDL